MTRFLDACQYIGTSADPHHGVSFTDPLDGAEIQWNPVRRATKKLPAGEHYIDARLPGVLWKRRRFIPRPWRVDTRANGDLATRIATVGAKDASGEIERLWSLICAPCPHGGRSST